MDDRQVLNKIADVLLSKSTDIAKLTAILGILLGAGVLKFK